MMVASSIAVGGRQSENPPSWGLRQGGSDPMLKLSVSVTMRCHLRPVTRSVTVSAVVSYDVAAFGWSAGIGKPSQTGPPPAPPVPAPPLLPATLLVVPATPP